MLCDSHMCKHQPPVNKQILFGKASSDTIINQFPLTISRNGMSHILCWMMPDCCCHIGFVMGSDECRRPGLDQKHQLFITFCSQVTPTGWMGFETRLWVKLVMRCHESMFISAIWFWAAANNSKSFKTGHPCLVGQALGWSFVFCFAFMTMWAMLMVEFVHPIIEKMHEQGQAFQARGLGLCPKDVSRLWLEFAGWTLA